ncbi:hypothetical protein O0L34_g16421 [Tuta absoluta]|nr:hypothetical protein O0L34_g16421 [Tuta absoluta]
MYRKKLYFILIAYLICNVAYARKYRRNKRPKAEEDSTPQPNVVTYSTFGFNDVGTYDGFVPSSPDYINYLGSPSQDSSSRLYAPAFPTAQDAYPSPSQSSQSFSFDDEPQASIHQYHPSPVSFMNNPSQENDGQSQNSGPEIYGRNAADDDAPIYGTKLSSKNRNRHNGQFNSTDYNDFGNAPSASENKYSFHEVHSSYENKPTSFGELPSKNYQYNYNYATTHPTSANEDANKAPSNSNTQSALKFPKVIDFTKYKQYYPTDLTTTTTSAPNSYKPSEDDSFFKAFEELSTKFPITSFKNSFRDNKEVEGVPERESSKPMSYSGTGSSQNYLTYPNNENSFKEHKYNFDHKDKFKYDQFPSTNYSTNDFKSWKNPVKGYQYSTNFSNINFEFDFTGNKKSFNNSNDEVVPASSNIDLYQYPERDYTSYKRPEYDFTSFKKPEHDYSSFKKLPGFKGHDSWKDIDDYTNTVESFNTQYKYDPEEYVKSLYSTVPTTTTFYGNSYKNPSFSSYKHHGKKPIFGDEITDDVVHIPKRPYSSKYGFGGKPTEWSSFSNHRPHKSKKPSSSWNKEPSTRFKSEEDLLGLRTHDTSHPSYLPTYKPEASSFVNDYDYKKLVEKWRQSYLRAKYKDAGLHDYEGYPSEPKPLHVPVPKPYPIEVPHPVIVPVPQPYPVKVPVPKPVAVPIVHELKVPIEKPVPYPVYKNVPYPVEKPMPYTVTKEVQVPVIKPYPVHIPHIRPVFHHTRPKEEIDGPIDDEDDYMPRPETSKRIPYAKRPRSNRNRSRRPIRTYPERSRRRYTRPRDSRQRRPAPRPELPVSYKHFEADFDDFDHTHSEYILHCKRTGNC